jgi:hypothetical protein
MARLLTIFATSLVIVVGLLTLIGLLNGGTGAFGSITNLFLQLTVITLALTVVIGVINLFRVHTGRILRRERGWIYSFPLLISATLVIVLWIAGDESGSRLVLEHLQIAIESALASLLVFALVYGAYRLLRDRVTWSAVLFTMVLLIVLVGALPLANAGFFVQVRAWMMAVPVSAGARGILLGIALATLVTGIRVLIGQDQSYRE